MTVVLQSPEAWLFAALIGICLRIVVVDWRYRIIPDAWNACVAGLGLLDAALDGWENALWAAAQGAMIFGLFWAARRLYYVIRGVHGLGLGDVKFLGAAGLWVGFEGIAPALLVACIAALVFIGLGALRGRRITARQAIPFGPFLVLGVLVVLGASRL